MIAVVIAVAVVGTLRKQSHGEPDRSVMGFDNPVYNDQAERHLTTGNPGYMDVAASPTAGSPGYMDVAAFSGESGTVDMAVFTDEAGYMDVAGAADGQDAAAGGYVDVSPNRAAESGVYVDVGNEEVESFDV